MNRNTFVLASMSAATAHPLTPVQVQKLFFILDDTVAASVGGPYFQFLPYDYGPFDKDVYISLTELMAEGLIEVLGPEWHTSRAYKLTEAGRQRGGAEFARLPQAIQGYISDLLRWIQSLTFSQLVSSIYEAYPNMKINSVFQDNA